TRILLSTRQFADALKAAKEFERTYNRKNLRMNIQLSDQIKLARVYFANGLLRESLKRINELINGKSTEISLEFSIHAHLMRLCIHYDLDNYSVLEHLSQTAKRFLEKHEATDDFAFTFIELIRQISKTDVQKKHREVFSAYLPILKKQFKEPFEQNSDLILWVEGKLK
ncbi:MAG TPA: hypothetical protein VFJ43_12045, partial [Bacteroidia bacterium]|nr:hypothetical protein [Bacteroidia bacterium]